MLSASFEVRFRTLICDLHGHEHQYPLLRDLMLDIILKARKSRVFRVEMITGRGKLRLPQPLSHREVLADRLLNFPFLSHLDLEEAQSSSVLILYLSNTILKRTEQQIRQSLYGFKESYMKKHSSPNDLRKLMREIREEETQEKLENLKKAPLEEEKHPSHRIQKLDERLAEKWDEAWVTKLLHHLNEERDFQGINEVLERVLDFEIFFSDEFRKTYSHYANRFEY